ncbi:universal stress protein [Rubrobacter indicoceani]|uniref:universal stress protein n=1 Tax=Rubrobacter indicoceani TaxID=2051957 RepID=UPI000E5A8E4A|nr:universal stress protein [Rubrobacter indicoceani]
MKCLLCVDPSDAERMTRNAARYLTGASEVVVVCAVDERAPKGYGFLVRGLLGRRPREEELSPTAEETAEETVKRAVELLARSGPGVAATGRTLTGRPEEELAGLVRDEGFDAVLIGRGNTGPEVSVNLTGTISGWKTNHAGDRDGLFLRTGDGPEPVEVRFPPHRGEAIERAFAEGATVEVYGSRRGGSVHAYALSSPEGGDPVEAHKPPPDRKDGGLMHVHLGHTARFVTDHVSCDVILVS